MQLKPILNILMKSLSHEELQSQKSKSVGF
jgi:hypothetical protein